MKIYCWLQVICCLHCFINNILDIICQYNLTDLAFLGIIYFFPDCSILSRFFLEKDTVLRQLLVARGKGEDLSICIGTF